MKLVYQNENRFLVSNAENVLRAAGIQVVLKNEFASGAMGELSPLEVWMQLWVLDDSDFAEAKHLLDSIERSPIDQDWVCSKCGETNGAAFELCWNCSEPCT